MNRRQFLRTAGATATGMALLGDRTAWADEPFGGWRTFEVTTQVVVKNPSGATRIWVLLPLGEKTSYQRSLANEVQCPGGRTRSSVLAHQAVGVVSAEFPANAMPELTVVSRVAVQNWSADLATPGRTQHIQAAHLQAWLQPTDFIPTDGIVRSTALEITRGAVTDEDKAKAIYDWVATRTYRKASVRGCGKGDIRRLLESGDLGGKCADLNALYVGLARAAGLPARDVYGLRVAPSRLGYKSLGPAVGTVTRAQHCRAEVWLQAYGWVPVDPADVRKVVLEEPPGNLPAEDEKVVAARRRLFGWWEMNWVAFNYGQDVALPGANGTPLHFFMYPQAQTEEGWLDSLDPDAFQYQIISREIAREQG